MCNYYLDTILFGILNYPKIVVIIVIEISHISYIIGTTWGILKYKFNPTIKSTVFNNCKL